MVHHPCGLVPSVLGLQVPGRHPREAPKVALEPRAQVVRHLHPLQADRVVHVGPVCLALEPAVPDRHAVRPLQIVDERRPGRYPVAHGLPHARRAGFLVAADDATGFLWMSMATQMHSFWRDRLRFLT